jgi:hypothetical protein
VTIGLATFGRSVARETCQADERVYEPTSAGAVVPALRAQSQIVCQNWHKVVGEN